MARLTWPRDVEGRLRLLMRAYPVAWRQQRGEELVSTVSELVGEKGRLGWSLAINIVLSGWRTRLREHPPLRPWLAYRLLDRRMPTRWQPWVRQDILGRLFPFRRSIFGVLVFASTFASLTLAGPRTGGIPSEVVVGWIAGTAVSSLALGRWARRRFLRRHGFDPNGDWITPPPWPTYVFEVRPREVRQVWPWLVAGGAAGIALAVPWQLILVRLAPTLGYIPPNYTGNHALPGYEWKMRVATAACAATSVVIGAVAILRLRRRLSTRTRVNRAETVPVNRWRLVAVVGGSAALWGALAVLRDHSTAREPYSLAVHCVILLIAPASLVAGLIARRVEKAGGLTVSWRDVLFGTLGIGPIPDYPPEQRIVGVVDPQPT